MAVISSAVRNNLLALQNTSAQQAVSQNRLATGKKVNSALDNPTNFFTASSLNNRASGLTSLLDGMANGVKTLEAADNGLTAIKKNIEAMQANIRSARADKSFQGQSVSISDTAAGNLTISGGALGTKPDVNVDAGTYKGKLEGGSYTALDFVTTGTPDTYAALNFSVARDGGTATAVKVEGTSDTNLKVTVGTTVVDTAAVADADAVTGAELKDALNKGFKAAGVGVVADFAGGKLSFTADKGIVDKSTAAVAVTGISASGAGSAALTTANFGFTSGTTASTTAGQGKTADELVAAINATTALDGVVRATNDGGKLRIENLSTKDLTLKGTTASQLSGTASDTTTIGGNEVRKNLISQFNDLRTQTDKLANDASFNGINLLKADKLKIAFNEDGTNNVEIQAKNVSGTVRAIDTSDSSLAIGVATDDEFSTDDKLDARLDALSKSVTTLSTQSSTFGSALTTIQTRQDFTKSMINTLQAGSDNLVNADLNEESATLLALNTRQQLSQTALSLASQADQAVLRLF